MSNYRRWLIAGGQYFFTVVTERRSPILTSDLARESLRDTIKTVQNKWPFEITAIVLLPDHFHTIWTLPAGDFGYSKRMKMLKMNFTRTYLQNQGFEAMTTESKKRRGERGVWQRRFWEHTIRDETDFQNHYHYIHYNPVKHKYVKCVKDWPYSSFHRAVKKGYYPENWGCMEYGQPNEVKDMDLE